MTFILRMNITAANLLIDDPGNEMGGFTAHFGLEPVYVRLRPVFYDIALALCTRRKCFYMLDGPCAISGYFKRVS